MKPALIRQIAYTVAFFALLGLVAAKLIDFNDVPGWLSLAGLALGGGTAATAAVNITKQRNDGTLD